MTNYHAVWQVTGHAFDGDDECWKCSLCGVTRDKAIHDQKFHTERQMVFVMDTAPPLHALHSGAGSDL